MRGWGCLLMRHQEGRAHLVVAHALKTCSAVLPERPHTGSQLPAGQLFDRNGAGSLHAPCSSATCSGVHFW